MKILLKLYVHSERQQAVIARLKQLCERELNEPYEIIIVDVKEHPELAESDKVVVTPTLIKLFPPPPRRIIGDLQDAKTVLAQIKDK
jgi:circadian clock protein KaiB